MAPKGWENIQEAFTRTNALLRSDPDVTFEQMIRNDAPDPYIEVKKQREEKARRKNKARGGHQGNAGFGRSDFAPKSTGGQGLISVKRSFEAAVKPQASAKSARETGKKETKKRAGPPNAPVSKKPKKGRGAQA